MAPNVSGNPSLDHDAITNLVYSVLRFSLLNASPGSYLLSKTFNGTNHAKLIKDFEVCYEKVKIFKPPSSRSESSELFICAQNLRKIKNKKYFCQSLLESNPDHGLLRCPVIYHALQTSDLSLPTLPAVAVDINSRVLFY